MRVLTLSVTAGYGHHATAKALVSSLEEHGAEVQSIDLFKYISKLVYDTVDKGYLLYAKFAPYQYGHLYSLLENNRFTRKYLMGKFAAEIWATKFAKFFSEFCPEAIVCTHSLAGLVINELKSRGVLKVPMIGIITDYTIHPFWNELDNMDYFVIASPLLLKNPALKNIHPKRILPFGIPVDTRFYKKLDKKTARKTLGLDENLHTIMVMSGSMGHGNMEKIVASVDSMDMPMQILCVCGNNKKIYSKINTLPQNHPRHVYGFVNNVDVMMDAADCLITKPGGLTVTEAMAKRVPMILVNPIPGQEERNVDFLTNNGVSLLVSKNFSVAEAVHSLFYNPERLTMIERGIELINSLNATEELCNFIVNPNKRKPL